jgi:hypothetical protein
MLGKDMTERSAEARHAAAHIERLDSERNHAIVACLV